MSWTVMGRGGPYHTALEPTENDDGSLTFIEGKHKSLTLNTGAWSRKFGSDGPVREMPRGVTGTSSGRPARKDSTRSWGEDNIKPAGDDD